MEPKFTLKRLIADITSQLLVGDIIGGFIRVSDKQSRLHHALSFTMCRNMMVLCDSNRDRCYFGSSEKEFRSAYTEKAPWETVREIILVYKPTTAEERPSLDDSLRWDPAETNTEDNVLDRERWKKSFVAASLREKHRKDHLTKTAEEFDNANCDRKNMLEFATNQQKANVPRI